MPENKISLGHELARFRARRGISQFDLAVCMGWKGTNPVVQIEKDRRVPQPETLEKLGDCLGLNYLEVHYLNGLAGYIPPVRLPPRDFVVKTLDQIASLLTPFPYPAYVVDYHFRFWVANPATAMFVFGDVPFLRELLAKPLTVFDIIFDSRFPMRAAIEQIEPTEKDQIFRFKAINAYRQHEDFFQAFPACMASLEPEDYQRFVAVWQAVDVNVITSIQPAYLFEHYARLEYGDIRLIYPEGSVAFHIRADQVLALGSLFTIVSFVPVASSTHDENKKLAEIVRDKYTPGTGDSFRVWNLREIESFW